MKYTNKDEVLVYIEKIIINCHFYKVFVLSTVIKVLSTTHTVMKYLYKNETILMKYFHLIVNFVVKMAKYFMSILVHYMQNLNDSMLGQYYICRNSHHPIFG